jgi:ABC-type transporter Mla subunit MlaD
MAKKVEIELDVKGNIVESTKNLKALKMQLKDVAAGTAEWNKIKNDIRDIEDALQSAGQSSEDFKGLLENAPGPLGVLGGAIKKVELATKSWGAALKATGIGLLVSLIGGLVAAFNDSEKAGKKLQPLFIGLEKIFNGVYSAVEPLFNILVELAIKALPLVSKAMQTVYGSVTATVQSLGSLGSAVAKFVKGDFSGAWKSAKASVTDFGKNYDESIKRFQEGSKELTKVEKEEFDKRKKLDQVLTAITGLTNSVKIFGVYQKGKMQKG